MTLKQTSYCRFSFESNQFKLNNYVFCCYNLIMFQDIVHADLEQNISMSLSSYQQ